MAQPEYVLNLINVYRKAQLRLSEIIALKEATGSLADYQASIMRQVNNEITYLNAYARNWTEETLPEQYKKGVSEAIAGLAKQGVHIAGYDTFAKLHTRAVSIAVANTVQDLTNANTFVGRTIDDSVRKAGISAVTDKFATGTTVQKTKQYLTKSLLDSGFTGITTKNGRSIPVEVYAETVARSTTREVTNKGTMNHLTEGGFDLVQMSSHATTCPVCAVYQGRVYSISGDSKVYPQLSAAFGEHHANIHPNCRHVLVPYIVDFQDDIEGDIKFSNRSFDLDPRSQKEMDAYKAQTAKKAEERKNRNNYEDMRLALGSEAPKSFNGYMTSKNANGAKWKELNDNLREFKRKVEVT